MRKLISPFLIFLFSFLPISVVNGRETEGFRRKAPQEGTEQCMRLRTNLFPWIAVVPNLGAEFVFSRRCSAVVDIWYSPWKLSEKYSLKTASLFPQFRLWVKNSRKGSFFNLHLNLAWYNLRFQNYRYQDVARPLLGGGIGYGYRLAFGERWGMEFEIGAGMANTKYARYYNVPNGAMKDMRVSTYWGIDRAAISFTYNLCDL